jgi:hypothetical protein
MEENSVIFSNQLVKENGIVWLERNAVAFLCFSAIAAGQNLVNIPEMPVIKPQIYGFF